MHFVAVFGCGCDGTLAVLVVAVVNDEVVGVVAIAKRRKAVRRILLVRYQVMGVGGQTALLLLARELYRPVPARSVRPSRSE